MATRFITIDRERPLLLPPDLCAAMEKTSHHRSVADLEKKPDPEAPPPGASVAEHMRSAHAR